MNYLSRMFQPKDMTTGAPWKRIVEFSIPMLLGNIAQQLYNTADSIIVGKYIGDDALAAVGSASPILNLLIVLFVGISVGAGIMVSQYYGAKDRKSLSHTVGVCISLTAITSVIIMILGPLSTYPILNLLNTPDSILKWSGDYLIIYYLGIAGFAYYNILAGVLRGLGDSISSLVFLVIATIINVLLDLLFVAAFGWGVAGVALATIIAQTISAGLCIIKLAKMKNTFDLNVKTLKLEKKYCTQIIKLGLPSGLTQAIFSLAMIVVQSLTNSFGNLVIACNVIVMRVDGFAMMPNFTFGNAMTTFAGQNIGANKMHRVHEGSRQGTIIAVGTAITITCAILFFGRGLMSIFTDTKELVDLGMHMMKILAIGYVAMAITQALSGVMRGAGDTVTPMWISLIVTVVLRVPTAYGIAYFTRSAEYPYGRPESTFISLLVSWSIGAIITVIAYKKGKWKNKSIINEQNKFVKPLTDLSEEKSCSEDM